MSYSNLVNKYIPVNKYTKGRSGNKICKITIHHMAGNLSIESCASVFKSPRRKASSNYGIGSDGRIACYVDEENRAWTSSSKWNDDRAITIEVANNNTKKWTISDKAMESLINLCADICRRYNFKLEFTGNKNGTLTRHNFYANTNCPGPYIISKTNYIVKEVNKRIENRSSKYYVGQRVFIDVPIAIAWDGKPGKSLVESNNYQFWVHSSVIKYVRKQYRVYGWGTVVDKYNDDLYKVRIFNDDFDCRPSYMGLKEF